MLIKDLYVQLSRVPFTSSYFSQLYQQLPRTCGNRKTQPTECDFECCTFEIKRSRSAPRVLLRFCRIAAQWDHTKRTRRKRARHAGQSFISFQVNLIYFRLSTLFFYLYKKSFTFSGLYKANKLLLRVLNSNVVI